MLPFNLSFRNLLRVSIPQLRDDDVDKYEAFVSLWHQLKHEKTVLEQDKDKEDQARQKKLLLLKELQERKRQLVQEKTTLDEKKDKAQYDRCSKLISECDKSIKKCEVDPIKVIDDQIKEAAKGVNKILGPVKAQFNAVQRLYSARRRLALSQGKFLQIPASPINFVKFIRQILKFRWLQIITFGRLLGPRLVNALKEQAVPKLALAILCIGGISFGGQAFHNFVNRIHPSVDTNLAFVETEVNPTAGTTTTLVKATTKIRVSVGKHKKAIASPGLAYEPNRIAFEIMPVQAIMNVETDTAKTVIKAIMTVETSSKPTKVFEEINSCQKCEFKKKLEIEVGEITAETILTADDILTTTVSGVLALKAFEQNIKPQVQVEIRTIENFMLGQGRAKIAIEITATITQPQPFTKKI